MKKSIECINKHIARIKDIEWEINRCDKVIEFIRKTKRVSLAIVKNMHCISGSEAREFEFKDYDNQFEWDVLKAVKDYKNRLIAELNKLVEGTGGKPISDEEVHDPVGRWYVTFIANHPLDNCVVPIVAESKEEAKKYCIQSFGHLWVNIYDEEKWEKVSKVCHYTETPTVLLGRCSWAIDEDLTVNGYKGQRPKQEEAQNG